MKALESTREADCNGEYILKEGELYKASSYLPSFWPWAKYNTQRAVEYNTTGFLAWETKKLKSEET